jgi:thiol-disulfide isomerase/thioredoxin
MRKLGLLLLVLMVVMTAGANAESTVAPTPAVPMDSVIGAFSTVDLEGNAVDSSVFAKAKLTLVNVWATFCGYCVDEMPDLAKLDAEYDDLQVLGVLGDAGTKDATDPANLKLGLQIAQETKANYVTILPDSIINDKLLANIYGYPTSFFVDQNGKKVGEDIVGAMGYGDWKRRSKARWPRWKRADLSPPNRGAPPCGGAPLVSFNVPPVAAAGRPASCPGARAPGQRRSSADSASGCPGYAWGAGGRFASCLASPRDSPRPKHSLKSPALSGIMWNGSKDIRSRHPRSGRP